MVDISLLSPGMKVKIVDDWGEDCHENMDGKMDKYLGEIVTVSKIDAGYIIIEEDNGDNPYGQGGHWYWHPNALDYIVCSESSEFEPASQDEFLHFVLGGGYD